MRNSGGFLGGLGCQMNLTLEDKCETKVNYDPDKFWFDLLMIRVHLAVLILCCTKPLSKVTLSTQNP